MTEYEAVVGMEVHAQLSTRSKMFCGCSAEAFGAPPNSNVCPTCLGLPGALPVANRRAVEQTILVGLALHCRIASDAVFARKNYFYPDLPKGYQVSMYELPLCLEGWLEIEDEAGTPRRIRIRRVHLEEDTAKLFHAGDHSLVDLNRAGLPLIEIVTEPDIRTPEEARQYLTRLRSILRSLGVSTADMEKGAMRCEANVSLRPAGSETLGTKVEVKNLNSFRAVKQALDYEIARQGRRLAAGEAVRQVTMGWDEARGRTVEQRAKEESEDYRYFPEPDLPPLHVSPEWLAEVAARLPELPDERRRRFVAEYGLSETDAALLAQDREVADYFEAAANAARERRIPARSVGNWIGGELFRLLNEAGTGVGQVRVTPEALAELVALVEGGQVTANSGKAALAAMFATGQGAAAVVQEQGLAQVSDEEALARVVDEVLLRHADEVAGYRAGKETLLQWFVGQVMRATRGKANPQVVVALLEQKLKE
ncbi:MAG TPA: Asp-tRNA(Asn)/Glu-tRNA(Gln) amidotransferase subunit GatB [Anaerolineae bacterium]|nr:Asp-tRNA(Asn)/Glu-tRNA(Gln) amidotransferase subunit GatB [Anaerolineae bacterium]